jgi:hypothetical protein
VAAAGSEAGPLEAAGSMLEGGEAGSRLAARQAPSSEPPSTTHSATRSHHSLLYPAGSGAMRWRRIFVTRPWMLKALNAGRWAVSS